MREIDVRSSFKQDYKNVKKQNWDTEKINKVITELQISEILRPELKDHALIGGFKGFRECHIYADLVVIYKSKSTKSKKRNQKEIKQLRC